MGSGVVGQDLKHPLRLVFEVTHEGGGLVMWWVETIYDPPTHV